MNRNDFRWDRVDDLFNQQPTELESNLLDSMELNRHRSTLNTSSSPSITTNHNNPHNNPHTQNTTSSSSSSSMNFHDNKPNSSYKQWIKKTKLNRSSNKSKSK